MALVLALLVGALYAGALYMMTRRSLVKLIVGLALLSHAANLLLFSAGGARRAAAPLVCDGAVPHPQTMADPLPQALILTAIVISFGVLAFSLALLSRAFRITGEEDVDQLRTTEE
jgi:multicomponent Na+:H+ antiporter subunit C